MIGAAPPWRFCKSAHVQTRFLAAGDSCCQEVPHRFSVIGQGAEETLRLLVLLDCDYFFVLPPPVYSNLVLSREAVAVNVEIKQTPLLGT